MLYEEKVMSLVTIIIEIYGKLKYNENP